MLGSKEAKVAAHQPGNSLNPIQPNQVCEEMAHPVEICFIDLNLQSPVF